jgi:hypothetical protein
MTTATLTGFLSKKEIEASYGRSYRSLTRDITKAVKAGNTDILRHLKLVTEDEAVREGTDVTLDMIQDLSNQGQRPMWLAEESWVADWCTQRSVYRRDSTKQTEVESASRPVTQSPSKDSSSASTPTQSAPVEFLQQRIDDQKQQIDILRGQLQIKDEQIRTANQLAEQSQTLMRDLHVLLKNVQDGLLGEGSRRRLPATAPATQPLEPAPQSIVGRSEPTADRPPRRPAKSRPPKRNAKRSNATKPEAAPVTADRLRRWFPTFLGPKRPGTK